MTFRSRIFFLVAALAVVIPDYARAQSDTTFTYQGELQENGSPANGAFNLDFELWDAATGGSQIGTTIENNDVPVLNGRFMLELDFGPAAFDNSSRWLEIEVNGGALSPRTPITRTPYSIQTRGIVVDQDKNVGIGTSTPLWELEVANSTAGDSAEIGIAANDAGGALAAYSSAFLFPHLADRVSLFSDAFESSGLDLRADGANSDVRFYTGGFADSNERMRITDTGNVGIGTIPEFSYRLDVDGNARFNGAVQANTIMTVAGDTSSISFSASGGLSLVAVTGPNGYSPILSINQSPKECRFTADVAIADSFSIAPAYKLHVDGTAGKPGGGSWANSSDRRLKKKICDLEGALESLLSLRGVTYEYKAPESINELPGQRIGMIAQEVEKSFPDWVDENNRGHKTVTYRGFEALTVEALRELRAEKDAQITALRIENKTVRDQLSEMQLDNLQLSQQQNEMLRQIEEMQHLMKGLTSTTKGTSK